MCHLGGGLFVAQVGVWMHRFAATKSEELQHGCAHHSSRALQGVKRHRSSSHAVVLRMLKVVQVDRAKERQLEHNDGLCCGSIGRRWQCLIATSDGEETKQLQRSPSVLWLQNYVAMLCVHLHGTVQTSVVEKVHDHGAIGGNTRQPYSPLQHQRDQSQWTCASQHEHSHQPKQEEARSVTLMGWMW